MTSKTLFTPELFVPAEVMKYIGQGRVAAKIKAKPEDFVVEERQMQVPNRLCTVATTSDLDETFDVVPGKPGLVSATLVKCRKTTFAAVYEVARSLGLSKDRVSYAGLKDRWALTAQRVVLDLRGTKLTIDDVRRACWPEEIRGAGWFIKDAAPANGTLNKGQLVSNRFTLRVLVPGLTARQLEEYIAPRLKYLETNGGVIPNAYGRQRLGRRQNLYQIGETLINEGPEAAIKRFLCETSPDNERPQATQLREKMASQWYYFHNMQDLLEAPLDRGKPAYQCLNMDVEYKIVTRMVKLGSFDAVMASMLDEFSLWIGAYQSYWFNQALAKVMRGEITLPGEVIPLLVLDKKWDRRRHRRLDEDGEAVSFYQRHLPEAVPAADSDPLVKAVFLSPGISWEEARKAVGDQRFELLEQALGQEYVRKTLFRRREPSIPRRRALIPVIDLEHRCEDGVWHCRFELRSGGYATTLLGLLFAMDDDEDFTADELVRMQRFRQKSEQAGGR